MDEKHMKELEGVHADILKGKDEAAKPLMWTLYVILEYLVTALMAKERQEKKAYLIHIRFIAWRGAQSARFEEKREWLIYADNYDEAVLKLDAHLKQGLEDETDLLVEYVNVTL